MLIRYIQPEDTLRLRSLVLRKGRPLAECVFPNDAEGFHLGVFIDDSLMSIATFYQENYKDLGSGGYRLRGMATHPDAEHRGLGRALIYFAIDELLAMNASYIWCNARSSAIGFYEKLGFQFCSEEFEIPGVGMHFNMIYNLNK